MLEIIGTSHIAAESVESVKRTIENKKPDIVALELDAKRAHSLLHSHKSRISLQQVMKIGLNGSLFLIIAGFLQKRMGKLVGVDPGSEMKAAFLSAHAVDAKIALIDRDIEITLRRLSASISWKEKARFLWDILSGPFSGELKELRGIDIRKVPSQKLLQLMLGKMQKSYPNVYRVLVAERNEYMARSIAHIRKHYPDKKVLAIVGAGHEEEIARLVKEYTKVY